MRKALVVLAVLAVVMPYGHAAEKKVTLKDVLSGNIAPLALTLKDLDGGWRRVSASAQNADTGGYMQVLSAMFRGMAGTGAFYTRGDTTTVGGETYIIAYRPKAKPLDFSILQGGPRNMPKPEKLTPETQLSFSLLSLQSAGSLTDIRPFNLEEEIAESKSMLPDEEEEEADKSLNNLKQLGVALQMYTSDWDDKLPPMRNPQQVQKLLEPYARNRDIFVNPKTKQPYAMNTILSGRRLAHISNPSEMVVFYEAEPAEDGSHAAAFLDGRAARIPESEWDLVRRQSRLR